MPDREREISSRNYDEVVVKRGVSIVQLFVAVILLVDLSQAEIPVPDDAPQPKTPAESQKCFHVPDGFRLELIACEPVTQQPSGVCWDAHGHLYVSELHGYNLEGHYDILELNKTGKLDRVVQRIQASSEAKEAAKPGVYGTVKRLQDTDGDGVMDKAVVFADRLLPCYGICPARDGIIAVCTTDILFLADRDGDGEAEIREVLYSGFSIDALDRSINSPQWGADGWITVSMSGHAGWITGPQLTEPTYIPNTDFRMKDDGSAIEPIPGISYTFGATFTERGERIVNQTVNPAVMVAPISWRYLARNPDFAASGLELPSEIQVAYPLSKPHPWRTHRAADPGFSKFYMDSYGIAETAPNGYFTSACTPLVYRDNVLPGLHGELLICEPSQNMVFRGLLTREETRLLLSRIPEEQQSEFLASTDSWFNPISLSLGPDGYIYIVDYYREIIEDYSAVPRYLQQQYGLANGNDYGRVWRLTHCDAHPLPMVDMTRFPPEELVEELASPGLWHRQTARRLLVEQRQNSAGPAIARLANESSSPEVVINALQTLAELNVLQVQTVLETLSAADAGVRIAAMRLAEPWLHSQPKIFDKILELAQEKDTSVVLQAALSLGESEAPRALAMLAEIARKHGQVQWIDTAIMSSLGGSRAGEMLSTLLAAPQSMEQARQLLTPLASAVAARRNPEELSGLLTLLPQIEDLDCQRLCWEGLAAGIASPVSVALSSEAVAALKISQEHPDNVVAEVAKILIQRLQLESPEERTARLALAFETMNDIQAERDARLAAVSEISGENDPAVTSGLLAAITGSTPQVRDAILTAVFSRRDRLPEVVSALEAQAFPVAFLSAVQRSALLSDGNAEIRDRASQLFKAQTRDIQDLLERYSAALNGERNLSRGQVLYEKHCGICHQAHGVGSAVGPDLTAEFKRAEETILKDILDPSGTITGGYTTYSVLCTDGRVLSGVLGGESASSITLKQPEGKIQTLLRKNIEEIKASNVSLMPENLVESLQPQDVADILGWLRAGKSKPVNEK
ncbi:PVC-type heme-binding CxxCH protein [Planctomicrobium sp. SH661]|uniref:PVC-type heme-binding CxxCH protein n=1 Tax=Planctomicrobium sp. SH661 TaxID=3448124 RepID=UPI003F5C648C